MKHSHYSKDVSHLQTIDVYRVLDLYKVTSPPLQHAAKKILCAGERGAKDEAKDIQEAIDSLSRWQNMRFEDESKEDLKNENEIERRRVETMAVCVSDFHARPGV